MYVETNEFIRRYNYALLKKQYLVISHVFSWWEYVWNYTHVDNYHKSFYFLLESALFTKFADNENKYFFA